jgi:hypothetical protein
MSVMRTVRQEKSATLRPIAARSQTMRRLHHLGTQGQSGRIAENAAQAAAALGGSGRALDSRTRSELEPRFGYDFSSVRVHTDGAAARASRSIGAVAYTAGTDIAFDTGRYQPNTAPGQALLAHELTHVAQQSHRAADTRSVVAPTNSASEEEANRVSSLISAGGALDGPVSVAQGDIQRATAGLVGGILGGVLGAGLAAAALEVLARGSRGLTDKEKTEARKVFGNSLDYGKVRVAESSVMTFGFGTSYARTPGNTIYFPVGTLKNAQAHESGAKDADKAEYNRYLHWLIHEMTHTWQTQHGTSTLTKLKTALGGEKAYDYKGEDGLRKAWSEGKHFLDFNTEQQADICANYYGVSEGFMGGDKSVYEPFIREVRRGGLPDAPRQRPEMNDGVIPAGPSMVA